MRRWLLILVWMSALLVVSVGCADPCAEIARLCEQCADPHVKQECKAVVEIDNNDACHTALSRYQESCKP